MVSDEMLQRINELSHKKKAQGLTPEETAEQKDLYKVYLEFIRNQVTSQLDAAGYPPKGQAQHQCSDACCGHHHDHGHDHHHDHGRRPDHKHAHGHGQHGPDCKH